LLELKPKIHRNLFGFKKDPKFRAHAHYLVDQMDQAIELLGPDLKPLREGIRSLGKRYTVEYDVNRLYFPFVARAIMFALEDLLESAGFRMKEVERKAWQEFLYFIMLEMSIVENTECYSILLVHEWGAPLAIFGDER
jgi:hypothetical protein